MSKVIKSILVIIKFTIAVLVSGSNNGLVVSKILFFGQELVFYQRSGMLGGASARGLDGQGPHRSSSLPESSILLTFCSPSECSHISRKPRSKILSWTSWCL